MSTDLHVEYLFREDEGSSARVSITVNVARSSYCSIGKKVEDGGPDMILYHPRIYIPPRAIGEKSVTVDLDIRHPRRLPIYEWVSERSVGGWTEIAERLIDLYQMSERGSAPTRSTNVGRVTVVAHGRCTLPSSGLLIEEREFSALIRRVVYLIIPPPNMSPIPGWGNSQEGQITQP